MIRKIRSSLSLKMFLLTTAVLMLISAITYIFIAFTVPAAYSSRLDSDLIKKADKLVEALGQTPRKDGERLIAEFSRQTGAAAFIQYPEDGIFIQPKTEEEDGTFRVQENHLDSNLMQPDVESESTSAKTYPFQYADSTEEYVLQISGKSQTVNQVTASLYTVLPWLIGLILLVSGVVSFFYSRFITKPILAVSEISQKISLLQLDWKCNENRTDEIGVLSKNLNALSSKLSLTLHELKTANQKLLHEIENDRELERQRMDFFSAVSHELKTPVTVLKGQLEGMLLNVGPYSDRDRYLTRALRITEGMEQMVYEILDISRVESAEDTLMAEAFDFSETIRRVLSTYVELMEQKKIDFHVTLVDHIQLCADQKLITKVVGNLLSNAVNYSPAGSEILIDASLKNDQICFSIENTGAHIEEPYLKHVFEAFYRSDQSRNRKSGGSGLGLYLVSRILQRYHADYHLENTSRGVKFRFSMKQTEEKRQ